MSLKRINVGRLVDGLVGGLVALGAVAIRLVAGLVRIVASLSFVGHLGPVASVAVLVSSVLDCLDTAVWQVDRVVSVGVVAIVALVLREDGARVVVVDGVVELVRLSRLLVGRLLVGGGARSVGLGRLVGRLVGAVVVGGGGGSHGHQCCDGEELQTEINQGVSFSDRRMCLEISRPCYYLLCESTDKMRPANRARSASKTLLPVSTFFIRYANADYEAKLVSDHHICWPSATN